MNTIENNGINLGDEAIDKVKEEYEKIIREGVIRELQASQPEVFASEHLEKIINYLTEQALMQILPSVNFKLTYKGGSENYK